MSRFKFVCLLATAAFLVQTASAFALMGIGLHYGLDMTLSMGDKFKEQTTFDNLKLNMTGITGTVPSALPLGTATTISGAQLPIFISRSAWENTGFNLGGKIYVDAIPFIDAIEVSGNFGIWQYNGVIKYPKSIDFKDPNAQPTSLNAPFSDRVDIGYDSTALTLENFGKSYFGVKKTPYAKFHVDATVRKYLLQVPPIVKIVKVYGGGGLNVDFATPMLSGRLIQDALGDQLDKTMSYTELNALFQDPAVMKKVVNEILAKMMTPHFGMHLALGTMVKIPMVPLGFYVDGKYIILFEKLDKYVDIGGNGLLLNFGVALAF
jgi:hypothetical protein